MTQVATINKSSKAPLARFADKFNVDPNEMEHTLKTTVFRQNNNVVVSNEQMLALMVVASEYNLNPFLKEIYAFPSNAGIVPIVSIDGWLRLINSHKNFDGMDTVESENRIVIGNSKACPEWIEVRIYRKDRSHPTVIREYLDECYKPTAPWNSHTKRMLRHKAIVQAGRVAFSFSGIYDEDEGERIIDAEKEVNEPPKPAHTVKDAPKNQSRTSQLMDALDAEDVEEEGAPEAQAEPVEQPQPAPEAKAEQPAPEPAKTEKSVKNLTSADKNRLLDKIKNAANMQMLNDMVPELSSYAQDNPLLIPIRTAFKDKTKELQKEK